MKYMNNRETMYSALFSLSREWWGRIWKPMCISWKLEAKGGIQKGF